MDVETSMNQSGKNLNLTSKENGHLVNEFVMLPINNFELFLKLPDDIKRGHMLILVSFSNIIVTKEALNFFQSILKSVDPTEAIERVERVDQKSHPSKPLTPTSGQYDRFYFVEFFKLFLKRNVDFFNEKKMTRILSKEEIMRILKICDSLMNEDIQNYQVKDHLIGIFNSYFSYLLSLRLTYYRMLRASF